MTDIKDFAPPRKVPPAPDLWEGEEDAPRTRRLDTLTWGDFRGKPVPPVEWLCEPFFPKIPFGVMASQPGHGKSFCQLQLGIALAVNLPFQGYPVNGPMGVGILALEDDDRTFHARMAGIVESYGSAFTEEHHRRLEANLRIKRQRTLELADLSPATLEMSLANLAWELGDAMQSTEAPPGVLTIDTLNAVHEGNENDAAETRPLVAAIKALHLSLGCSVWALHHYRKAGIGKNSPPLEARMDPEIIRGSTAIQGAVRGIFQFGWITRKEAQKGGIQDWKDPHQYAVVGLTKFNGGPKSVWELWKHGPGGILIPVREGDRIIASILGGDEQENLSQAEKLLVAIHQGSPRKVLADHHFGGDGEKLKAALANLRRRHGWLQPGKMDLTVKGFEKVQQLSCQQGGGDNSAPDESEEYRVVA
jgi:hypothetical protein